MGFNVTFELVSVIKDQVGGLLMKISIGTDQQIRFFYPDIKGYQILRPDPFSVCPLLIV
jgi:hypothetical protein